MIDPTSFHSTNKILKGLPAEVIERLAPAMARRESELRDSLYKANGPISHVYFPESAICSIVANTSDGLSTEVAVVGCEGATGIDVLLGADSSANDCEVQGAGAVVAIGAAASRREFVSGGEFQKRILRYLHDLMTQISQTTLCNRLHAIEPRLARWLLMCHDRVGGDELKLTQEYLAIMLGVSRVSVTMAAGALQGEGLIGYSRGNIRVLDRDGLEKAACDCYAITGWRDGADGCA